MFPNLKSMLPPERDMCQDRCLFAVRLKMQYAAAVTAVKELKSRAEAVFDR
jgi:hypothetical protein